MRWVARGLAVLVCLMLIVAVLTGTVAPGLVKARVEASASRALGRAVTVGRLTISPVWPPTLVARDVAAEGMGTVRTVTARFRPASLLGLAPTITALTLVQPRLLLPLAAGYAPHVGQHADNSVSSLAPRPASRGAGGARVTIERAAIEDGRVELRDPRTGHWNSLGVAGTYTAVPWDISVHAEAAAQDGLPAFSVVSRARAGEPIHIAVTSLVHGQPILAALDTSVPERLALHRANAISLVVTAPGATLTAIGTQTGESYDVRLVLHADHESRLAAFADRLPGPDGPVQAAAHAIGDSKHIALDEVAVSAPEGQIGGAAELTFGAHPHLRGTWSSQRLDLDAILSALAAAPRRKAPPPSPSPAPGAAPSRWLIPDRPLPLAVLARADVDVSLAAKVLHFGGIDYRDLGGHFVMHGGHLAVQPFTAGLPGGGQLDATLQVDASVTPPLAALTLHAPALALAPTMAALRWPDSLSGTAALDADLRGTGATLHALASGLGGTASLRLVGDGAIDSRVIAGLLRAAHLPVRLPPGQTRVSCAALDFTAHGGVLDIAPLVVDSDRLRIDGAGGVDLGRETLALNLHPLLRGGIGLVIPVQLAGSWRGPKVTVGVPSDVPASTACPAATQPVSGGGRKPPKPIDLLRSLLR